MRFVLTGLLSSLLFISSSASANPYWDPAKVPSDSSYAAVKPLLRDSHQLKTVKSADGIEVIRIQVDWQEAGEVYSIGHIVIERSGTPALLQRAAHQPKWGSYLGLLRDNKTGEAVYYDAVGTGKEYRKLTRAMTFRFPVPATDMTFELYAENPQSGVLEKVAAKKVNPAQLKKLSGDNPGVEIKELYVTSKSPSLRVNIYAEGYTQREKEEFWRHAMKVVNALHAQSFPGVEYMSFYAVFHDSNVSLGRAKDLGKPIPERDSFLGMYYPYWDNFGRWYNVIYPTREAKMRTAFAEAPYDFPIILANDDNYWGVGNYMAFTAIPAANDDKFTYLLMHEFGHFFGLNEEYQGGGRTELEFASGIKEPWSQNITFLSEPDLAHLKWNSFVDQHMPIPTPRSAWQEAPPAYGAYLGGYADSRNVNGESHIPGYSCTMENKKSFCQICRHGVEDVIRFQAGL